MASYPTARIKWLITKEGRGVATPNTITRQDKDNVIEIYSYRLCIGLRQAKGTWWVHPRDNSATTNRHIDALTMVISETHDKGDGGYWYPK